MGKLNNTIPPMNSPLCRGWFQPNVQDILVDDTHALMEEKDFNELKDYSLSHPSGVYEGKMWKSNLSGTWYLMWYGFSEGGFCSNNHRKIIKLEKGSM